MPISRTFPDSFCPAAAISTRAGAPTFRRATSFSATATVASLHRGGIIDLSQGRWAIVGLLGASALAKSVVAFTSGGARYGLRMTLGLASMVAAAALAAGFT